MSNCIEEGSLIIMIKEVSNMKKKIKVVESAQAMACSNGQLRDGKGNKDREC